MADEPGKGVNLSWQTLSMLALATMFGGGAGRVASVHSLEEPIAMQLLSEVRQDVRDLRDYIEERTSDQVGRAEFMELEKRVRGLEASDER